MTDTIPIRHQVPWGYCDDCGEVVRGVAADWGNGVWPVHNWVAVCPEHDDRELTDVHVEDAREYGT